ncbi:hypothetical protein CFBP2118_04977 [Pseudomonas syringae pv. syringae]|nr:hypothetical protein CFBP2118_04977 [Pseudomonas syringae pv. syringae]
MLIFGLIYTQQPVYLSYQPLLKIIFSTLTG